MKGEVQVYRNLHRTEEDGTHVYSVKNDKNHVEDHVTEIALINPKFRIQKAGQKKVRREGKKNVHAYIQGKRMSGFGEILPHTSGWRQVTYNPYRDDYFVLASDHETEVVNAVMVHIEDGSVWALNPVTTPKVNLEAF